MLNRLIRFRKDIITLWHAFRHPLTPLYLKALMVLTALYVISPVDIITDIIPIFGWVDDVLIVSMMVSFIVWRLPRPAPVQSTAPQPQGDKVIDGTYRRR